MSDLGYAIWRAKMVKPVNFAIKEIPPPEKPPVDDPLAVCFWGAVGESVAELLAENVPIEPPERPKITPKVSEIKAVVARYYGITVMEIDSERRQLPLVAARHMAMYLAHKLTKNSYPEIGRRFGGKDHTTVLHAVQRMTERVNTAPASKVSCDLAFLMRQLGGQDGETTKAQERY